MNLATWSKSAHQKSIVLAAADKQLQFFTTADDMKRLIAVVTKWRLMLGLSKDMSEEELKMNCKFIKDSYPKITIKDIDLAITISLQGGLDVNPEPYGTFSPLYISRILNAFITYSEGIINKAIQDKRREERLIASEPKKEPYEVRVQQRRDYIVWWGEQAKKREKYLGDFDSTIWNFLTKNNLLKADSVTLKNASDYADNEIVKENNDAAFRKFFMGLRLEEQQIDTKKRREMYGRFYTMKKFFESIPDVKSWIESFDNQKLIAPPKS